jgi:hypothetical protein
MKLKADAQVHIARSHVAATDYSRELAENYLKFCVMNGFGVVECSAQYLQIM